MNIRTRKKIPLDIKEFLKSIKDMLLREPNNISVYKQFINYYSKAIISKTIDKKSYVIDCVPFDQQPALIDKSKNEKIKAFEIFKRHNVISFDDSNFDFKSNECKSDEVPIPRPQIDQYNSGNNLHIVKTKPDFSVNNELGIYRYLSAGVKDSAVGNNASATFGVGPMFNISLPYVTESADHEINQLWWIANYGKSAMSTLESGWITSSYFSSMIIKTTLFAFSTTNDYAGGKTNLYNYAGGFIGYPGAPSLGTPVNNVNYKFTYTIMDNNTGYELSLTPFYIEDGIYSFDEQIPVGYYPMDRYTGVPYFKTLSAGSEAFIMRGKVCMAGKFFGYGIENENYDIAISDHNRPLNCTFSMFDQKWNNLTGYTNTGVQFEGCEYTT